MGFEKFVRGRKGYAMPTTPSLRVSKNGSGRSGSSTLFRLSPAAMEHLGSPRYVLIWFDRVRKMLAIDPLDQRAPGAYTLQHFDSGQGTFQAPVLSAQFDVKVPMLAAYELPAELGDERRLLVAIQDLLVGEERLRSAVNND